MDLMSGLAKETQLLRRVPKRWASTSFLTRTLKSTLVLAAVLSLATLSCTSTTGIHQLADAAATDGHASGQFLGSCVEDDDCVSGRCTTIGDSKGCTKLCSEQADCPKLNGWTCNTICECRTTPTQADNCSADSDCDGLADRQPTQETCNGIDDDCNGTVDDVEADTEGAKRYYLDSDGDGFGQNPASKWACKSPGANYVEKAGDCDDKTAAINPDATEICGDQLDSDCDGESEDVDICGLSPIIVTDVRDNLQQSAVLKSCGTDAALEPTVDITEIIAKQDQDEIKFTLRLAGAPATNVCSTYKLNFGAPPSNYDLVYVFRHPTGPCGSLAGAAVYANGQPITSGVENGFNAANPGHISFIISKTELYGQTAIVGNPTYHLRACTNATADATKDITDCTADSCEAPIHR